MIHRIIPIFGDLVEGHPGEVSFSSLKGSGGKTDQKKEGLRVIMEGAKYGGTKQKAVVEFVCDPKKTGLEGSAPVKEEDGDKKEKEGKRRRRRSLSRRIPQETEIDDKSGDKEDGEAALKFVSYDREADEDVLRLEWRTKLACPEAADGGKSGNSGRWGFFTWVVIM